MRLLVVAAAFSLSVVGLSMADDANASIRRPTNIPAEGLVPALKQLAHERGFQLVFQSEVVGSALTQGATGDFTTAEALSRLLEGTNLVYRYLDEKTVTILKASDGSAQGASPTQPASAPAPTSDSAQKEGARSSPFLLAQAAPGSDQSTTSSVETPKQKSADEGELQEVHPNTPEILIKGSRIMNVDVKRTEDDVQPYYVFDSQMIEQSGAVNVEDFLKQRLTMNTLAQSNTQSFPSVFGAASGTGNGTLGGTSTVNLRGLGSNETLILIDGRRAAGVNFSGTAEQPDINGIPPSAIERIEVLPSSASAIYGGAAVGGVVNIILKKKFQGGQFDVTYENTTNASAPIRSVNATYGFSLGEGKTQIMLSGRYSDSETLLLQDRLELTERGIQTILRNSPGTLYSPGIEFSGATPNIASAPVFDLTTFTFDQPNLTLTDGTPLNSQITHIPAGAAPGQNLSAALLANAGKYNLNLAPGTGQYGLQSPFGSAPRSKSLMATIRQELTDDVQAFAEFALLGNSSRSVYNPFSGSVPVPAGAPDIPFSQSVLVNFPSALSVPTTTNSISRSATVGLLAPLGGDWRSELDYTWSENSFENTTFMYDPPAVFTDLASGTLNPFVDTIAHPLDLARYLVPVVNTGPSTLNDLALRVSGSVGSLPWGRPTLTVGLEHRKEGFDNNNSYSTYPLDPTSDNDFLYFGQSQSTNSVYAEAQVPLVTSINALPGLRSLDLQLAGRSERYRVFAGTPYAIIEADGSVQPGSPPQGAHTTIEYTSTNPTVGLKYQPVHDLTLRASYAKAFLPPTAAQLLPNPTLNNGLPFPTGQVTDPENGLTYLVNVRSGGNPSLQPQTSQDWDLGAIWEPQEMLKGLRVDVEHYNIVQPNYITIPSVQDAVSIPGRATRDPATGLITTVDTSYTNATDYKTNGWDFKFDYRKATPLGTFELYALGTVIEHDRRDYSIGSPFLEYVGYPGEGGEAKTKANATLSWEYRGLQLGWTVTYFGSYLQAEGPGSPFALQYPTASHNVYTAPQGGLGIPSQTYHELFGSYRFDSGTLLSNVMVQFGIKNIFNTLPPFDAFYSPYYYSPYGDIRLRDYWLTIRKSW